MSFLIRYTSFFLFHLEIMDKKRTAGDGMESDESTTETIRPVLKPPVRSNSKDPAVLERLIQVFPTAIIRNEKKSPHIHSRSPKFVPYEPYPAAVKPIITPKAATTGVKKSRNNMDINTLISQMSQMNTNLNEFKPRPKLTSTSDKSVVESEKSTVEMEEMKQKINDLMKENESLKEQLKQQAQVIIFIYSKILDMNCKDSTTRCDRRQQCRSSSYTLAI